MSDENGQKASALVCSRVSSKSGQTVGARQDEVLDVARAETVENRS